MRGETEDRGDATFYVVRVGFAGERFHAEVRDVRSEHGVAFDDAAALADFLFAVAPHPPAADSSPLPARRDRKETP